MSLIKKLAGETAIYGLSSIVGRLVNWVILTPFLTRAFSQGEYGIISDLYFYIAFLLVLFTYRMETAFFRYASRPPEEAAPASTLDAPARSHHANTVFTTASLSILATTIILTGLLLLLAPDIASWLRYPGREDYVRLFVLIIAFDALAAVPFAKLRLDSRPLRFAITKLGAMGLNILLIFFFLEFCPWASARGWTWVESFYRPDRRVAYVFWANLIASGATLLVLAPLFRGLAQSFAVDLWRRMMRYSLPLVLAALAGIVNQLIGTPMLKYLGPGDTASNLDLAGIFAAAAKLAVLMNLFIQAFNYAAEPFFFRQAATSDDRTVYADVARAFALVGSLAFLGIMLYLDIIQYFLGDDFREGLDVLPLLLVANYFLGLYYNFAMSYKLTDRTHLGGYIALGGSLLTVMINVWLIPSLGYLAPGWASLACYGGMAIAAYYVARRFWPVDYPVKRMVYYLLLALGLFAISELLRPYLDTLSVRLAVNTGLLLLGLGLLWRTERGWLRSIL
ncbi:MAG: polysaccharide biosynthesis C-terminal domain-containing protein [Lewinella sp.]|nr:polysaccharide biosynthesis C-terminal domain-containing protein [Lewinella sp.]